MILGRKYIKNCFFGFRSDFCWGWLIANCHLVLSKRIIPFTSEMLCIAFVTHQHRKLYFHWKCSLFPVKRWSLIQLPKRVNNFCHTSAANRYLACNCSLVCIETIVFYEHERWAVFAIHLQQNWCKFMYLLVLRGELACRNGTQPSHL